MTATNEKEQGVALVRHVPSAPIATSEILSDDEIKRLFRVADALAKSGLFKDTRSGSAEVQATKAFAKMIIGRDLGLNTTQSMLGLHVLPNGVQVHYATLLRFVRSQPGHDYRIRERSAEKSVIDWILDGEVIDTTEYTMEEARTAGKAGTEMYTKIPATMLLARNVSRGIKEVFPEALAGIPLYVDDELPAGSTELSEGEGTGEAQGLQLAPEVEDVIAWAKRVGHAGYAERSVWEMWVGSPTIDIPTKVAEARADLQAKEASIEDAQVVEPDVPIDTEGLPESNVPEATFENEIGDALPPPETYERESLGDGETGPSDGGSSPSSATTEESVESEPVAQETPPVKEQKSVTVLPEDDVTTIAMRRRLTNLLANEPPRSEDEKYQMWEDEIAFLEGELDEAAPSPVDDSAQGSLL